MSRKGEELLTTQIKDLNARAEQLQVNYEKELLQRRRLHNMLEDMKGKIRVYCRMRPLNR